MATATNPTVATRTTARGLTAGTTAGKTSRLARFACLAVLLCAPAVANVVDPAPIADASWPTAPLPHSRITRRLAVTVVQPGEGTLQAALAAALPGHELVLADGTYTGDGGNAGGADNVLVINKDITIRAQNAGQAVLDGQGTRRVLYVESGTVSLEGLDITNGNSGNVCSCAICPHP